MIKVFADFFEGIAEKLGLPIKMPRPGGKIKNISIFLNGITGIVCVVCGVIFRKSFLAVIGAAAIAGAILLTSDQ